ncbi:LacI family DNA-binding transcriptional regulator [Solirubrobacter sp. CPCC 204708]|uniref:LacI family transcriptional regulator n=1 Tax=Solirubrobacter deserti TaxID=2282478 RepID=A0ABT4RI91_9ACTN|nr:LacI family DNA-binding transcriptional regulator [Solirubrobacter deserti]MBE2318835.1 LacI family DNA-binding transcriptional regulator [Solirubrobacter deserti]MDA0138215.1 LacI family transcriptional regulator [Solirubrobacter deserti]
MTRRRPTIADVARRAGVSAAAVSFAVNDRPGVSPETRERILAAARELGWRPSASARALTEARTRAIGLVLARDAAQLDVDAFFVRFLSGIGRALSAADYALLLQLVPEGAAAALPAYERLAAAGRVDGFLLTDVEVDDPRFAVLEAAGVPVLLAGRPVGECPFAWVETRHEEGMAGPVAHLARLGHTRVCFFGGRADFEHVQVRRERWRNAVDDAGVEEGVAVHAADDEMAEAARVLLTSEPTAVVCGSDVLAVALVRAARERGLDVPGDLSVTGFDDSPLAALSGLTSVRVDYAEFGEAAAGALLAELGVAEAPAFEPSAPELVLRASTAPPPSRG